MSKKNSLTKMIPNTRRVGDLVLLILLAVNEKIYMEDLLAFDVLQESIEQEKKCAPLISWEYTSILEKTVIRSSTHKYVINAKFWLLENLGKFVEIKSNQTLVVEAYRKIIGRIIQSGSKRYYNKAYEYYRFDVINDIFKNDNSGQIGLIKAIYAGLENLLSSEPHYFHQRAKCYLWQSKYKKEDLVNMNEALRFVEIAIHNFKLDFDHNQNYKLALSIAHAKFTKSLILSRISIICAHEKTSWMQAINGIYEAWEDESNIKSFIDSYKSKQNKSKVNDIVNVINYIHTRKELDQDTLERLNQLRRKLQNSIGN